MGQSAVGVLLATVIAAAAADPAPAALPRGDTLPVYVAFAGPYSSSPSSSFGHVFLVLPETDDQPLPLWDVVSFAAETNGAGPLRYMVVGIVGGFWGQYERLDFHEKSRDYEVLEDRDLWLVELRLSVQQRVALDAAIEATSDRWFPYTFFSRNSAYYLQLLLSDAIDQVPSPGGTVSPVEVFEVLLNSGLAGGTYFRPSASSQLAERARDLDDRVVARLKANAWTAIAADTVWLRGLSPHERQFVQDFFAWRSLKHEVPLPREAQMGLGFLRVLSASARGLGHSGEVGPGDPIPPPAFPRYTRIGFFALDGPSVASRVGIRIRPALRDEADPTVGQRPINTIEFLTARVSSPIEELTPRLDELVLFSQHSLSPSDWITQRNSWMLEIQARRGGLFSSRGLHFEIRTGSGRTVRIAPNLLAYGLVTAGAVGPCCRSPTLALGARAGISWLISSHARAGLRWSREVDALEWSRQFQYVRGWARLDLSRMTGVTLAAETYMDGVAFTLSLDWYR